MNTKDMEIEVLSNEEKRECRRQRRVRNQRRAYISLVISVLVLVAVVLGGLFFVNRQLNLEQQISEQPMEEIEVIEEEIIEEVSTLPSSRG